MFLRERTRCRRSFEQLFLQQGRHKGVTLRVVPGGAYRKPDISIGILVDKERTTLRISHFSTPVNLARQMERGSATAWITLPRANQAA
ncbi:hypothetical protein [Blastomonas sp.]|uniref:hypothetical protein n=1 Tax=Blastomonas sp. TaxID=1909299 RepID=UPI002610B6A4|nr:hypothetical protein [Blastomonas sp.]MDM7956988.1 hypothetical protein [Blastomonas sp.]